MVQEIKDLQDARIDQIYQPDNTEIILALHKPNHGKYMLRIMPGVGLYITSKRRPSPQEQINFCRFLRKRLGPTRLKEIIQKKGERIVEFHFEGKDASFILITEFFSKGNIILCDPGYTIISALQVQLWKDRKIKAKVKYEYPPQRKASFETAEDFTSFLKESKKENVVKTLALGLNLGGVYAEELCFRAKVKKDAQEVSQEEIQSLFTQWKHLQKEKIFPNIIHDNPVPFKMQSLGEGQPYTTYSEALDIYYSTFLSAAEQEVVEEKEEKIDKQKTVLEEQEQQRKDLQKAAEENQRKAEWIYEHYMEVKELLDSFRAGKKEDIKKKGVEIEGPNLLLEIE